MTRVGRVRYRAPGPAPGGKVVSNGGSCRRRRRMATSAWARCLLPANHYVEIIVGRGRWGDSWHKTVILSNCGLFHSINYWQNYACRIAHSLYHVSKVIMVIRFDEYSKLLYIL